MVIKIKNSQVDISSKKYCTFAKNIQLMKKEKVIEICVDNLILSALSIAFICILCVLFGSIDDHWMDCNMSKTLFCIDTTVFGIFASFMFYSFKKLDRKFKKLLSILNGIIILIVMFIFSKDGSDWSQYNTYIYKGYLTYIFIILFLSYTAIRYELRQKDK